MKCPHCKLDIREAVVLSAAAAINAKRRRRITTDEARRMQRLSVIARRAGRPANEQS